MSTAKDTAPKSVMEELRARPAKWRNWSYDYLKAITTGKINAPKRVIKQYEALRPVFEGKDSQWKYDKQKGNKPIDFAEVFCRQSKDAWIGKPIKLLLWQKAAINAVYGIVDRKTGKRRFQKVFILVGKKNGKTTMIAPIALYESTLEGHTTVCAANGLKQASIVWEEACNMLDQSPAWLRSCFKKSSKPQELNNVTPRNYSMFAPLANKPNNLDGKLLTMVILDEVHELQQSIYDILAHGQISVEEPLLFMLSTKGYTREGLFDSEYDNSRKILDGLVENDRKFSLLYELDNPDDWQNEDNWIQANPSLGVILTKDKLRQTVQEAVVKPAELNSVKVKHFNLGGVSGQAYFEYDTINNTEIFDLKDFKGCECIGGFDLSRTNDLTAFTTLFMKGGRYYAETMYWVSEDFYKKSQEDDRMAPTWQLWVDRGLLRVAGVHSINYTDIVDYVLSMVYKYKIYYRYIYYDPWSAAYLVQSFQDAGFMLDLCLKAARQGAQTLSVPFQRLEAELRARHVIYNNNPITKWCITNVDVREDANKNVLPCKAGNNNKRKIDGFATLLDCFVGVVEHGEEFGVM